MSIVTPKAESADAISVGRSFILLFRGFFMKTLTKSVVSLGLALISFQVVSSPLKHLFSMAGSCQSLIVEKSNLSKGCNDRIMQSTHSDGRIGFTVSIGDKGAVATFSGFEDSNVDANTGRIKIDTLIFNLNIQNVPPTSKAIQGECIYTNPYIGKATIACQAIDENRQPFVLKFKTDGKEPQVIQ